MNISFQKQIIELIKEKILFVLTKSDQKTDESMIKISEGFKKDINHYLKVDDIDNRLVSFSSQDVLENRNKASVENLLNLFDISYPFIFISIKGMYTIIFYLVCPK